MLKWSGLLVRLGGRCQPHFSEDFFSRLDQELLVVNDYGYVRIDFHNDPDLVLPDGDEWDTTLGKKKYALSLFLAVMFLCFHHFLCFWCLT